jgi:hypothetical protein
MNQDVQKKHKWDRWEIRREFSPDNDFYRELEEISKKCYELGRGLLEICKETLELNTNSASQLLLNLGSLFDSVIPSIEKYGEITYLPKIASVLGSTWEHLVKAYPEHKKNKEFYEAFIEFRELRRQIGLYRVKK